MGNKQSGLNKAIDRAESKSGKIAVSGRYHKLPKKLEDEYHLDNKVLGTGYNGSVFRAKNKVTGAPFAVKGFHLHGVSSTKKKELETEAEIFLQMDHPHVARLVAVYECDKQLNLVMECMEGGELFERVSKRKRFSERDAANAVWQMLLAVNYIHGRGIVHRDLKLENFLYEKADSDHLKLIDFGFSHVWEPNTKMALSCGTLAYVAPEVLNKSYTGQCDLWSIGVIVFILLAGYMPFNGSEDIQIQAIKTGRFTVKKDKWESISNEAKDFSKKLLTVDPNARLTAEMAMDHPFIKERDQKAGTQSESAIDGNVVDALKGYAEASQFRRACMSMMAWSLTNEERAQVRNAFIELDKNKTGTITLCEMKTVLQQRYDITDNDMKALFDKLDATNDEEIHYSEFLAAMVSTRIALHDDMLTQTFRKFDVDNSGYITADNLKQVLGESFDGGEVADIMKEADLTADGRISYDEFIAYLKDGQTNEKHARVADKIIDHACDEHLEDPNNPCKVPAGHLGLTARVRTSVGLDKGTSAKTPEDQKNATQGTQKSRACTIL